MAFLLLTGGFAYHATASWRALFATEIERLSLLSEFEARAVDAVLQQLQGNIVTIAPLLLDVDGRPRIDRIERAIRDFKLANPGLARVGVVGVDGTVLYSSTPTQGASPFEVAALRRTFDDAAATADIVIGRTQRNLAGRWVIPLRYAVRDDAGEVRLFIAAGVAADDSGTLFAGIRLPEDYALRLLRTDGHAQLVVPSEGLPLDVLYEQPLPAVIRQQIAGMAPGDAGTFESDRGLDGRVRMGAFKRLERAHLVSVVSLPRERVVAAWRKDTAATGALYLLFLGGLALVWRFAARARDRADAALRAGEERFRDFAEASADWFWETDTEGRFVWFGGSPGALPGTRAADVIGKPRWSLPGNVEPPDHELWQRHREDIAAQRPFRHLRYGIRRADGSVRRLDTSGRPYRDAAGKVIGYRGAASDVTELIEAQVALRHANDRLARVFRNSPAAIAVHGENDVFLDVNDAFERLYGWPRKEILGRTAVELGLWADAGQREAFLARCKTEKRIAGFSARARQRDGTVLDVEIAAELVEDDGEALMLAIVQDVTARKRAEQALRTMNEVLEARVQERTKELSDANAELEAFVYSVSHDLRAPLRGIDGFSQLLEDHRGAALDTEARGYLRRVRAGTQRMGRIIDDLLALSRVRKADFNPVPVDLTRMARSVAAELSRAAPDRTIEWHIADGMHARCAPGLAHIVLTNLLSNAVKYTGKVAHPVVHVERLACEDGFVEICVRDNGAGFDEAYASQLFQPFKRLHGQHEFDGTGVGLAIVQRAVERHGGRVRGIGRVGHGASFFFTLPAVEEAS